MRHVPALIDIVAPTRRAVLSLTALASIGSVLPGYLDFARAESLDKDAFKAICTKIVGDQDISDDHVAELLKLLEQDADAADLQGLLALGDEQIASGELPEKIQELTKQIAEYFYLGRYKGKAAPNRADIYFDLVAFKTVDYQTIPSACKGFGYWTEIIL